MNKVTRIIGALALLAILAFCLFGFMATFEPLDLSKQITWRIVYGLTGLACLSGIAFLLRSRKQSQ